MLAAKRVEQPDSIADRLVAVARHLLEMGVSLHEIGPRIYDSLTGSDDRARLFRAGLGVSDPTTRDEASRLASEVEHQLRGPRDYTFETRLILAHMLDRLVQAAHDAAEELRAEGAPVTAGTLEHELIFAVANARPRSEFFPAGVSELDVERAIPDAVAFFFRRERRQ